MTRDVLTRQVIASGRIRDAISGSNPRALPQIMVVDPADGRPVNGLTTRVLPDAHYAVYGDPVRMLPPVATQIRIEVTADRYQPNNVMVDFTAAELIRAVRTLDVGGRIDEVEVIPGVPRAHDVALTPLPVWLKGRVAAAEDPSVAIAGASIEITAPAPLGPVITDEDGYFTLGPAPVTATLTLGASAPGRTPLSTDLRLDFSAPTNRISLALETI